MKYTRLNAKNKFILLTNQMKIECDSLVHAIARFTDFNVKIGNVAEEYQNKILQLEVQFQKKGLDFFSSDNLWVRYLICEDLYNACQRATKSLDKSMKLLDIVSKSYRISILRPVFFQLLSKLLQNYQAEFDFICSYQLDRNFVLTLLKRLYSEENMQTRTDIYENAKGVLTCLGLEKSVRQLNQNFSLEEKPKQKIY